MRRAVALLGAMIFLGGCAAGTGIDPAQAGELGGTAGTVANENPGGGDQLFDSASADNDALDDHLYQKYGVHPRRYTGFFDGSNDAEIMFDAALPEVETLIADRISHNGYWFTLDRHEIAINAIAEGAYFPLVTNQTDCLDGFQYFGIDTLVDNLAAYRPWLSDEIIALANDPDHVVASTNELGETVHTLTCITLAQGLSANASLFAWSRAKASDRIGADAFYELPQEAEFFWTTIFYNAGVAAGRRALANHGVGYYETRWRYGDDAERFGGYILFNADWRTASYEYLLAKMPLPDSTLGMTMR